MKTKKTLFLLGTLALVLVFALVLAGCAKKFDGSSLVGSVWTGEISADLSSKEAGKVTGKVTGTFTTDSAGTLEVKVTKWEGNWSDSAKKDVQKVIDQVAGDFTYTYDPFKLTGYIESAREKFTIDVTGKTLTVKILDETVLNLQKAPKVSRKLTGPLTKEEAESLNTQAGIEKGWKFAEGEKYEDLVVKQGKVTAAKCITTSGAEYVSLEADGQGNLKAARYTGRNGNVFEQYESFAGGGAKAAKLTTRRGGIIEQWEMDAEGNETQLKDGQRVNL